MLYKRSDEDKQAEGKDLKVLDPELASNRICNPRLRGFSYTLHLDYWLSSHPLTGRANAWTIDRDSSWVA